MAVVGDPPLTRTPTVRRRGRGGAVAAVALLLLVALLAALPFLVFSGTTSSLVTVYVLLVMACMWNLLAGFGGLVSVGQQAYVGLGAYAVLFLATQGWQPFLALPIAALVCALIALPTSLLAFRLRGDYFAVGTWVIAEVYRLFISRSDALGGPSGRSVPGLSDIDPVLRGALTYWAALAVAVLALGASYVLLRSRLGLALTALRDDEVAARASGVDVTRTKRIVYLLAAAGTGAAGGVLAIDALSVQPNAVFSVQWSAYMIFIVVVGGIGFLEGPLLGVVVFYVLQQTLADQGATYLIVLGLIGAAAAIWLPQGLWGKLTQLTGIQLLAVGHHVAGRSEPDARRPTDDRPETGTTP